MWGRAPNPGSLGRGFGKDSWRHGFCTEDSIGTDRREERRGLVGSVCKHHSVRPGQPWAAVSHEGAGLHPNEEPRGVLIMKGEINQCSRLICK